MPMKRSGRSVAAASRVIEIEDVLVPTIGLGLERRTERAEDLALDVLLLGRRLDHEVAIAQFVEALGRSDALDRGLPLLFADALAADLARQVAADGGNTLGDAFGGDVVEQNVKAGERADMGDAAAHLAGADHADLANRMRRLLRPPGTRHRPLLNLVHVPCLFYDDPPCDSTLRPPIFDDGQRRTLPSSVASSGNAW